MKKLNSGYGAYANKFFQFADLRISESITRSGQCAVRWMEKWLNKFLNEYFHTDNEDYVITIDTDSVIGSSEILVNNKKIKIEDYYNSLPNIFIKNDELNKDFVKQVNNGDVTKSVNDLNGKLEDQKINYIMKHNVNKRFYKITYNFEGNYVILTEDHSIIVYRNKEFLSIKPKEINRNTDSIIVLDIFNDRNRFNFTKFYSVEDLGVKNLDVYDIEVENNHNFFANDILVHNSLYLNLHHLIDKIKDKKPELTDIDCINILDKFAKNVIEPQIQTGYEEFHKYVNSFENWMVMKRECLCSSGVFVAKKRYCLDVFDNEGVRYEKPKLKIKGLDVVRSSTPDSIKSDIKEIYKIILDKDEKEAQQYIKDVKNRFNQLNIEQIAITSSISNLEKYYDDYKANHFSFAKGTPIHVKAAITYNNLIDKFNLQKSYQYIKSGDKIKYVFLKEPNICRNEAIAFLNFFPKEFNLDNQVDYNKTFDRVFIGPVKNIMEPIKWNWEETNTLDDLFC